MSTTSDLSLSGSVGGFEVPIAPSPEQSQEEILKALEQQVLTMVRERMTALNEHFVTDLRQIEEKRRTETWHKFIEVIDVHQSLVATRVRLSNFTTYDEWGQNVLKCATRISGYLTSDGQPHIIRREAWDSFLNAMHNPASPQVQVFTIHESELCKQIEQYNRTMNRYRQEQEQPAEDHDEPEADESTTP